MSSRIKELIAIHQLDPANLQSRIERNAPGMDAVTIANIVNYIDTLIVPELVAMFEGQAAGERSAKHVEYVVSLAEKSFFSGFGYGMQYQDGLMLHKKILTRFTAKNDTVLAMPDPLETAIKAIFRSVYAAFEQAIEETASTPKRASRKKATEE